MQLPAVPPAPDDYPTFPDTSTWPSSSRSCRRPTEAPIATAAHFESGRATSAGRPAANYVAVVMDGNGRFRPPNVWAGPPNKMGEAVVIDIACGAIEQDQIGSALRLLHGELKRSPKGSQLPDDSDLQQLVRRRRTLKAGSGSVVGSRPAVA